MFRFFVSALLLAVASTASADMVTTFEDQNLAPNSYVNNAGASGVFTSGGNTFNNSFNATYGSWSGWAMSSRTDGTTDKTLGNPDYTYQYSSVTGSGFDNSATYAVAYTYGSTTSSTHPSSSYINLASNTHPVSIEITNTAYAYHAVKYGDQFSTPFQSGDYFELTINGYTGLNGSGAQVGQPIDVYLANYLNGNSFVLSSWKNVNLSSLAGARSLVFGLSSSDNGTYGMNTPAYFAADNLVTAVPEPASLLLTLSGLAFLVAARRPTRFPVIIRRTEGRNA